MGYFLRQLSIAVTPLPGAAEEAEERVSKMQSERDIARERLLQAQLRMKRAYDKKGHMPLPGFKVNDWVWLSTKNLRLRRPSKKLADKWIGPFQITEVKETGSAVRLALPQRTRIHDVFNVSSVKLWKGRPGEEPEPPSDDPFNPEET